MCLNGLKKSVVLFLVFLLVLSSSVYSEVILTDEEYQIVMKDLEESKKIQKEQSNRIMNLESDLMTAKTEQKQLKKDLTNAQEQQKESSKTIKKLKNDLTGVSKSLKMLKKEQRKEKIKSFCWGLGSGFVVGMGTGIYTSNKFK